MGLRKAPYVFTLEGVKIFSTILKKSNVPSVTEEIIKAFENLEVKNNRSLSIPVFKGNMVQNLIYEIDGIPVILDIDLAKLYDCKNGTKEVNQAVKNNPEKFPESYSWILSDEELQILRSKILTFDDLNKIDNRKYRIRVFTESGTWMLSTILKTPTASQVTMMIIDAFVKMRRFIGTTLIEQGNINNQVLLNTKNIDQNMRKIDENSNSIGIHTSEIKQNSKDIIKNSEAIERLNEVVFKFDKLKNPNAIFFGGQIYDAYSKIYDIVSEAKKELVIVDGYADKQVLDMISKLKSQVTLIIKTEGNLSDLVIKRYNEQYHNLKVVRTNEVHDRFIILDKSIVYHCGASINHAGRGAFAISLIEDEIIRNALLDWINDIILSAP